MGKKRKGQVERQKAGLSARPGAWGRGWFSRTCAGCSPLSRGAGGDDAGISWAETELTALGEMVRVCGREEAERPLKTFRVEVR
jgi:hypothetical protein